MKKVFALLLALMLAASCVSALAAEPGAEAAEVNTVWTDVLPSADFALTIPTDEALNKWAEEEEANMWAASPEAYFKQAQAIAAIIGEPPYDVNEFWPLAAENYSELLGPVTATFLFATPYTPGDKVAVMIGFDISEDEETPPEMEWLTFEGTIAENHAVVTAFDPETLTRIQEDDALIAIVSKPNIPGSGEQGSTTPDFPVTPPSRRGSDLNKVLTSADEDSDFYIIISENKELIDWANEELEALQAAPSVSVYFDQSEEIRVILEEPPYEVNELWPSEAGNYEQEIGAVYVKFSFATPYTPNTTVALLIGFKVGVDEEGKNIMEWKTFEGSVLEDSGIVAALDPETIIRIQENNALIAVVSK